MKKIKFLLMIAAVSAAFVGCKKDDEFKTTALKVEDFKTATIYGTVKANLDSTLSTLQVVPAGTKIVFEVKASVYDTGISGSHIPTVKYVATTDAEGNYSVKVRVGEDGATTVKATAQAFFADFKRPDGTSEKRKFTASISDQSCLSGVTYPLDITFTGAKQEAIHEHEFVKISGTAMTITPNKEDATKNDTIAAAAGTTFKVTVAKGSDFPAWANDWSAIVTVEANGVYSVEVPSLAIEHKPAGTSAKFAGAAFVTVPASSEEWVCEIGTSATYASAGDYTADFTVANLYAGKEKKNQKIYFFGKTNLTE